jgi:hypothetical protein
VARRVRDAGDPWVEERLAALSGLLASAQSRFLLELAPTATTWEQVDRLDPDVQAGYWRSVSPYALLPDDLTAGVERLLAAERPWAAIDVLAGAVHDGGEVDVDLADRVLAAAAAADEVDAGVDPSYEVGQVLDAMERSGAPIDRLATHEFAFFGLLDQERAPRALAAGVAAEPELFVLLVRHAYLRADLADEPDIRVELATHAHLVLDGLHRVPGAGDDGVDADVLRAWVHTARAGLAAVDRADIGDECLGQFLARAPAEEGHAWPPLAVREVVEEIASDNFESGLQNGHVKARGVTTRGVYDGGSQERGTAAGLRADAAVMDVRWARTARMLRALATTYEGFAAHEDRQAQHAADDDS